jgi:hypothetical protein
MSTCNRLDLQTLGSQPIMPKNLPDHCFRPLGKHLRIIMIITTTDSFQAVTVCQFAMCYIHFLLSSRRVPNKLIHVKAASSNHIGHSYCSCFTPPLSQYN